MTTMSQPQQHYDHYERQTSAGGVVYRFQDGSMEILLCGRREPLLWALPKGTPDPGEGIRFTALREVEEETGVSAQIVGKLGRIRYFFTRIQDNTRCDKTVHHYLMEPIGGDPSLHDHEFDDVRWFSIPQALQVMSYVNETNMVIRAVGALSGKVKFRRLAHPIARSKHPSCLGPDHG